MDELSKKSGRMVYVYVYVPSYKVIELDAPHQAL